MSSISSHVLDIAQGQPARGINLLLEKKESTGWKTLGHNDTNEDGRVTQLYPEDTNITKGIYRLTFATKSYFAKQNLKCFYPQVEITFELQSDSEHYHVPLLICGYGYSTYRGS